MVSKTQYTCSNDWYVCILQSDKTALHIAAEEGHLAAVMRLIDLRCDVNKRDKVGLQHSK